MLGLGKRRILAISPHSDDVELGCAGYLARELAAGSHVSVAVVVTRPEMMRHTGLVAAETREQEFNDAMDVLGLGWDDRIVLLKNEREGFELCNFSKSRMISIMDDCIEEVKATTVLLPVPSFHQEHQYVFECGMAATRPTKFQTTVKEVFAYEYPAAHWGPSSAFDQSRGGVYVDITPHLPKKLAALSLHESQCFRAEKSLISLEAVEQFAKLRGIEAGFGAAELLYLLRAAI